MGQRGRFIVLEGIDGAGTTTQGKRLASWWEQSSRGEVHLTAEPSSLPIGKRIREILGGGELSEHGWQSLALLFAADRLDHVEHEIEPLLAKGTTVISDRYTLSSLVYQGLHVDVDWVGTLNRHALQPDLTIWVDVPVHVAMERMTARGNPTEVYEKERFQEQVYRGYLELYEARGVVRVDGLGTPDEVHEKLTSVIKERLG